MLRHIPHQLPPNLQPARLISPVPQPCSSLCHTGIVHTALHIVSHHAAPRPTSNRLFSTLPFPCSSFCHEGIVHKCPSDLICKGGPIPCVLEVMTDKQQAGPVEPRVHLAAARALCLLVGSSFGLGRGKSGPIVCRCKVSHLGQPLPFPHAPLSYHPAAPVPPNGCSAAV